MVTLFIDTRDRKKTIVAVCQNGRKYKKVEDSKKFQSQTLLLAIDKLLRKRKVALNMISEIEVETGPGSFTGLRIGIAVANCLGFMLDVPANGRKEIVLPQYD